MIVNKKLISLAKESRPWIILTVVCNVLKMLANIVQVVFIALLIEKLFTGAWGTQDVILTAAVIAAVIILKFILTLLGNEASFNSSAKVRQHLRDMIYAKLLELELGYLEKTQTAHIVTSAVDGVEALQVYFGRYLPQLFFSMIAPLILFIYLSTIHFGVALILLLAVPLIPLSIIAIMKWAKRTMGGYWGNYENLGSFFLDSLQGLTTLKIFVRDEDRGKTLKKKSWAFRNSTMRLLTMQLTSIVVMDIIAFGCAAIGIVLGGVALARGSISLSQAIIILFLAADFFLPLRTLGSYYHAGVNGIAASEKIFALLEQKPILTSFPQEVPEKLKHEHGRNPLIKFENVSFSYDKKRPILQNINLTIEPGQTVALVGESGSGKSTVGNMIARFFDPDEGRITLNSVDLKDIPLDYLRKQLSIVPHSTYIFAGTIADNLRLGNSAATESEMLQACKVAGFDDFVQLLPHGLATDVGEKGSKLSGGEKQRLAIARAVLHDANFYIFDEATSNIDIENENKIWDAITELAKQKTTLIISHRLVTVENADTIYVLQDGKLVEAGKHKELIQNDGIYKKLVEQQAELERYQKEASYA